jgi:hypothetical protein
MSAPTDEAFLARTRSEGPVFALHVEMCMAQHLSLTAYSVEKLRHAKIASEIWNAVPTIG